MVLALGKRTFYEQVGMPQGDAYTLAAKVMTENAATDDAHEGIQAFLEKRPPHLDRPLTAWAARTSGRTSRATSNGSTRSACAPAPPARTPPTWSCDPRLFGEIYAAPYGVLEPEHALVLDDGSRRRRSATCSARSTPAAFEARCEAEWWPPLRERHPKGSGGNDLDELLIAMLHEPHLARRRVLERPIRRTSTSTCCPRRRDEAGGAA